MKVCIKSALVAIAILIAGCAAAPQPAVYLPQNSLVSQTSRMGIVMTALPKVDMVLPGAGVSSGCLLCMAIASISNFSLAAHVRTLPYEDLRQIKEYIGESLCNKGINVTVIEENLNVEALAEASAKGLNLASRDFSPLQQKYNVDKLLVIDINTLGVLRTYTAYLSTSNPQAVLQGAGYIVNLKNNAYEWYMPVNIVRSSDGDWDQPPNFPRLTKAYFQTLKTGKDNFLRPFDP